MTHTSRRQQPIKITKLALIAAAMSAATIGLTATAHADITGYGFQTPSGNIGCEMDNAMFYARDGVVCEIRDHTWGTPPPSGDCHMSTGAGYDLMLGRGDAPCVGHWMGQVGAFVPGVNESTLDYGQTVSVGTMSCDSEPTGVTCTDTSTGHFFRLSRESYQLG